MIALNKKAEFILIVCLYAIFFLTFEFPDFCDIVRYYQYAEYDVKTKPYIDDYFLFCLTTTVDFIYHIILYGFTKIGLSLDIVSVFFLSLYSIVTAFFFKELFKDDALSNNPVYVYSLFSAPFIWFVTISRTLAAISLFYIAIYSFVKNKHFLFLFFLIASFFTHVCSLLFIVLFICSFFLSKIKYANNNPSAVLFFLLPLFLVVFVFENFFSVALSILPFDNARYGSAVSLGVESIYFSHHFHFLDKIPILFLHFTCVFVTIVSKRRDVLYWNLFLLTLTFSFTSVVNVTLTQRIAIALPLFLGANILAIQRDYKENVFIGNILNLIAILGLFIMFLNIFLQRNSFSLERFF